MSKNNTGFWQVILTILCFLFTFLFPHFGGFGIFLYPFVVLLFVWLFLKFTTGETFSDLLFSFKRFELKAIWIGIVTAILLSCFFNFIWDPLLDRLIPNEKVDLSDFANIRHNTLGYLVMLVLALLVGGFYEELIFHGFIFTRLEIFFVNRHGLAMAVIVSNIIFGLYHFQQGIKGILLATVAGFVYHLLILRFRRNLWYGIFVHAFFDFIGLTLIYLGYI